ncbi:MAG: peroxiredoxin [Planctomycetia bacterium]|nr:peroxiredoxin [Planctomycetia bacterium]
MNVLVTQPAPLFKAHAVLPGGEIAEVSLEEFRGQYVLLFFYPMDFTFVCPTEIIAFSEAAEAFAAEGVQILSCSTDTEYSHFAWRNLPREEGGLGEIRFPMVADVTKEIAASYGVLLPAGVSLRGLFLIDKEGIIRHQVVNDLPLGRSVQEAMRMVQALKFFEAHGEVCPANWQKGGEGIKPTLSECHDFFEKRYSEK